MTLEKLNQQIKTGNFYPLYFFYGEERYLLRHKLEAMKKKLIPPAVEDFNYFCFDGKKTDIEAVMEAVAQFPQMSEKKLIVVKNSGFFNQANSREYKRLAAAAKNLPPYVCLVLTEDHWDKKKAKNIKFIEDSGGTVEFSYLTIPKLEAWLEDRFRKAEKQIAPKELSYIITQCGTSLEKLDHEYDKILNYLGDRDKVQREDIDAVVDKTVECRVYDMLDNMTAGRGTKAQEQMKYFKDAKEQPTVILGIMMGKLSELLLCKQLRECGLTSGEIGEYFDFRRPMFAVNKTVEESKRYREDYLQRMIKKGLCYDADIKNGRIDGWTAAELYLAELLKRPD